MERIPFILPTGGREKNSTALVAIATALGLAAMKGAAWTFTGSVAILASAADSLMDAFASTANYLAIRMADTPEDREHRYGHGKVEAMAGLFQALIIGGGALVLLWRSIVRLIEGARIEHPGTGIAVMAVSLVVTTVLTLRMRAVAKRAESLALKADSVHYFSDVLANAGVIASLAAYQLFGVALLDPVVSILISGTILFAAAQVFRESFDNLIDRQLPDEEYAVLVERLRTGLSGALGFHDLRTRRSGARRFVDVHVEVDRNATFIEAHRVAEEATRILEASLPNTRALVHADPWPPDPEAYDYDPAGESSGESSTGGGG